VLNYTTTSGGSPVTTSDIGNIIYKSDVGNYVYPSAGQPQPHGVQSIASPSTGTTLYTISYDSVGKVLTDGLSGNTITYTPFQMPLKVTPASGSAYTVQYDADHHRIMRTVGTSLVIYLPDSDLTVAPASAKTTWNTYFMAAGQRVAQDYVTQSGSSTTILTEYFESDYQNSIGMVTDDKFTGANAKVDQGFDAFGRPRSAAGVNASPWPGTAPPRGYINQVMLTGEQIIDLNARYYDPALARFLEPDPLISDMDDSQAWNAYAYAHNNPMSKEDPTGLADCDSPSGCIVPAPHIPEGGINGAHSASATPTRPGGFHVPTGIQQLVGRAAQAGPHSAAAHTLAENYNGTTGGGVDTNGNAFTFAGVAGGLAASINGPTNLTHLLGLILATEVAGLGPEDPVADAAVLGEIGAYEGGAFAAAEGAGATTNLFRAVTTPELESIQSLNAFSNPAGIEVKYFSTSLEGAQSYASQATSAFGDGPFSFVRTSIPTSSITPEMSVTVDRGIQTVVVPTGQLPGLSTPVILPH
jgi:RHS repeat-associated protein